MATTRWGPSTWIFLHTLVAKIKPEKYTEIFNKLYSLIIQICTFLPCPECSKHALAFFKSVKPSNLKEKHELVGLLYVFHSKVNGRLNKTIFPYEEIKKYEETNLIQAFNDFSKNYNTNGDLTVLADSLHRTRVRNEIKKWLIQHIDCFIPVARV